MITRKWFIVLVTIVLCFGISLVAIDAFAVNCLPTQLAGDPCDDNNACTTNDVCLTDGGICKGTTISCDDNNPCTTDTCNTITGCKHTNNTALCDYPGNKCIGVCSGGVCTSAPKPASYCYDDTACTIDSCDPVIGCIHTPTPCCVDTTGNNFTMIDGSGLGNIGGTNDVRFTWDCTMKTTVDASGQVPNATVSSTCPFFGLTWLAHDVAVYGPGKYTIYTACPAGSPGCGVTDAGHPPITFIVNPKELGAHMLFNWNGNFNIDLVNVWTPNAVFNSPSGMFTGQCGSNPANKVWDFASRDVDGVDGIAGYAFVDGPFQGASGNFNMMSTSCSCPDDGNPCTDEVCLFNVCTHVNNTATCSDNDACTTGDVCSNGVCTGTPLTCPAGLTCDTADGVCKGTGPCADATTRCDDGNFCTADSCDPATGACIHITICTPEPVHGTLLIEDGSFFCMNAPYPNGNCAAMSGGIDGGLVLGSYQPMYLLPDVCNNNGDGTGYTLDNPLPENITYPFDFFGTPTYISTNPISWQMCAPHTVPSAGTGSLDSVTGCRPLTADIGAWEVYWNTSVFEQGPKTGTLDNPIPIFASGNLCSDNSYELSWPALIVGGPFSKVTGYWLIKGHLVACKDGPCDDGNPCTINDTCSGGVCAGTPVVCNPLDQCHVAGVCDPGTGICSNSLAPDGKTCNADNNKCTGSPNTTYVNDSCSGGICVAGPLKSCDLGNPCKNYGTCNTATGNCPVATNKSNGTACDDGNPCTVNDVCTNGVCAGAPITCLVPPDQCHMAGACVPGTGACDYPPKPNGSVCNDGNACITGDVCSGGVCVPGITKDCNDNDTCTTDSCDPATGLCVNTVIADCAKITSIIQIGYKAGSLVLLMGTNLCGGLSSCTDAMEIEFVNQGIITTPVYKNPGTVSFNIPAKAQTGLVQIKLNGTVIAISPIPVVVCACDDGNICTTDTCDTATGNCTHTNNTLPCNDGNACTINDTCQGGVCMPGIAKVCTALAQCHVTGTCDTATGACSNPPAPNGTVCNDGNACTTNDVCTNGTCGGIPLVCNGATACMQAGVCNTATGVCSYQPKPDGTSCDDGNPCNGTATCKAGVCTAGMPVVCNPATACVNAGVCNPATGLCTYTYKASGTACDDGNYCTVNDKCDGKGICVGTAGNSGKTCNDNNTCTTNDKCVSGVCKGVAKVCNDNDACTTDTCDTVEGCGYTDNMTCSIDCGISAFTISPASTTTCSSTNPLITIQVKNYNTTKATTGTITLYKNGVVTSTWTGVSFPAGQTVTKTASYSSKTNDGGTAVTWTATVKANYDQNPANDSKTLTVAVKKCY